MIEPVPVRVDGPDLAARPVAAVRADTEQRASIVRDNPLNDAYRDGYVDGLRRAIVIIKQTEVAPNTRAVERQFEAAKRRFVRVLRGAVSRNV